MMNLNENVKVNNDNYIVTYGNAHVTLPHDVTVGYETTIFAQQPVTISAGPPISEPTYSDEEKAQAALEYKVLKLQIAELKTKMDNKKKILLDGLNLVEGTNTFNIGQYTIKIKQEIDRKVNYDELVLNAKSLSAAALGVLRYKAELRLADYKKLPDLDRALLEKYVTSKPESPQLEFKGE